MIDILLGGGAFFVLLAVNKAIIEPLATSVGRKVLDKHLSPAIGALDSALAKFGLEFNAEDTVREYLDLCEDEIEEAEKQKIIEEVFREWDLRKVTK